MRAVSTWAVIAALAATPMLAACQRPQDREPLEAVVAPKLPPLQVPEALLLEDGRVRLPVAEEPFVLNAEAASDPLPDAVVPEATLYDVGLLKALEEIFAAANVPITVIALPGVDASRLTLIQRRPVRLAVLLEQISVDQGIFYTYTNGVLRLSRERSFTVSLPPIGSGAVAPQAMAQSSTSGGANGLVAAGGVPQQGNGAGGGNGGGGEGKRIDEGLDIYQPIAEAIEALGGKEVKPSRVNRTIVFTASRDRLPSIRQYLERMRTRGKLVIIDTWIVEVQLSDSSDVGIDWNQATINFGGGRPLTFTAQNSVLDAFTLGFTGTFGRVSLDALASFLATKGTAQTVASPRLMMLSGSRADFTQGENIPYVSSVQLGQSGITGALQTGGSIVYTNVGLAMAMIADAMDDSVFLSLGIRTSNLIEFRNFKIGDVVSDAPRVAERTYAAELRLPIGEPVVINGIRQSNDNANNRHLPGVGEVLPLVAGRDQQKRSRSELVLVLRPRVVEFVAHAGGLSAPPPVQRPGRGPALPLPDERPVPAVPDSAPGRPESRMLDRELERDAAPVPLTPRPAVPRAPQAGSAQSRETS